MLRPDRDKAFNIPIGVIPGGSGNALIASLLYACKCGFVLNYYVKTAILSYCNVVSVAKKDF